MFAGAFMNSIEWRGLTRELCAYRSGVVALENETLFKRLKRELSFVIHTYESGLEHNGWIVPPQWEVLKALLRRDGELVYNGMAHPLGVAQLSQSFRGELTWEELSSHIVSNPALPTAHMFHCMWQYRPWAADWALCVPWETARHFGPGNYEVELETVTEQGEMLVAEYTHIGARPETIVFQSNTCHPGQANDGFGAVALLVRLFQWLRGQATRHTYKLLLGPEHLGTVFWLRERTRAEIEKLAGGIFMEMPGVDAPLKAASSFLGAQDVDRAVRHLLRHCARKHVIVPWRKGAGNDETVWEAPGYEVPFVELTRCIDQFAPYPEYHSSLDTPERLNEASMEETFRVLQGIIAVLEADAVPRRRFDGLICLSNPRYDLYMERPDPSITKSTDETSEKWGHLLDCLFRYLDGSMTVLEIAERHDLPFELLRDYLVRFGQKGLIRLEPKLLRRPPLSPKSL